MTIQRLKSRLAETAAPGPNYRNETEDDDYTPQERKAFLKQWKQMIEEFYTGAGNVKTKVVFTEKGKKLLWTVTVKLPGKKCSVGDLQDWVQELLDFDQDVSEENEGAAPIVIDFAAGIAYTDNSVNIFDIPGMLR